MGTKTTLILLNIAMLIILMSPFLKNIFPLGYYLMLIFGLLLLAGISIIYLKKRKQTVKDGKINEVNDDN